MAEVKAFCALRPNEKQAAEVAALPYDVYTREEARAAVQGHPFSFLNIDRPETQFPENCDMYAQEVYEKARGHVAGADRSGGLCARGAAGLLLL